MEATLRTPASRQLCRRAAESEPETIRIVLERAQAGSLPREHSDQHRLALVVEGGGMGGAVTAGMCVALEALGLVPAFDMIVACSAGALNGAWTAAGQAAQGATNYEDLACRQFVNPWRLLLGRAPIDFGLLFDGIAVHRKPIIEAALRRGPAFHCLATSLATGTLRTFSVFDDVDALLRALRASCTLPVLGGAPVEIDGERFADGGLIESMPFRYAQRLGATHVLVLRSRWASYRKSSYSRASLALSRRADPALGELVRRRPELYNEEADLLEKAMRERRPDLVMIGLPDSRDAVAQLERNVAKVRRGIVAGARAAATWFCGEPVDLHWQPRLYGTGVPVAGRFVPA
jgi:predicted patatin/cPLA2 family phospholipase